MFVENFVVKVGDIVFDMGMGMGIIVFFLVRKVCWVFGVDINFLVVELVRENVRINGIINVEFWFSDLFENVLGEFDVIMFNVFYLFGEFEELIDFVLVGGEIGREVFDRFIDEVFCYLKLGGVV